MLSPRYLANPLISPSSSPEVSHLQSLSSTPALPSAAGPAQDKGPGCPRGRVLAGVSLLVVGGHEPGRGPSFRPGPSCPSSFPGIFSSCLALLGPGCLSHPGFLPCCLSNRDLQPPSLPTGCPSGRHHVFSLSLLPSFFLFYRTECTHSKIYILYYVYVFKHFMLNSLMEFL